MVRRLADAHAVKALDHQLGVDKPLLTQYWNWLSNFPGTSTQYQAPIGPLLTTAFGHSLKLALFERLLACDGAAFAAVVTDWSSAMRPGRRRQYRL